MKIPLKVYFFAGGLRAMVRFLLQSKAPHIFGSVEAIVDTGSPVTILGIPDMKRMKISKIQISNLESRKEPISYGGGQVNTKVLREAKLTFGEYFECIMPVQIPVDELTECSQPTILGVDFLIENKLKFVFDPNKKEAYFESSE